MHKRIGGEQAARSTPPAGDWLDIASLARVELTSEDPAFPFESAVRPETGSGWRAQTPGMQHIRLVFSEPQRIRRVRLVFEEEAQSRTQEFTVAYSADPGQRVRELVRQQYTFSPPSTTREVEEYTWALEHVTALEVRIVPSISGDAVCASVRELRLA
jgi:hypothetical protein